MALNRQFMDFCLCYKIKNKSNINTGIIGGQVIRSEVLVSPRPLVQQPEAACWPVVTLTTSVVPSGPSSRPRTKAGGDSSLFPGSQSRRLAERALSAWKCRKVPEEVGSNFQGGGGGGNCPPPWRNFLPGTCGWRPPPLAPPPVAFSPLLWARRAAAARAAEPRLPAVEPGWAPA